jgi:hypothetical protein
MAVVTLDRLTKIYERGHAPAADRGQPRDPHGEFMVLLGPVRLRQDHDLRMIAGLSRSRPARCRSTTAW